MQKTKIILFSLISLLLFGVIGYAFWDQELKYALPTPKPIAFRDVKVGEKVDLRNYVKASPGNVMLHFYNPDCPCSRFNMKDFEEMAMNFGREIQFFVVVQSDDDDAAEKFKQKYEMDIPVILDKDGQISDLCGIYSTPQAVLLNKDSEIFFKGNYNKTRFCTRKETKFAEMAAQYLLKGEPLPMHILYAQSEPYGCTLPTDEPSTRISLNFF
jgi:AhpC/TSA family